MVLITIDAHSKWIEAQLMTSTTTTATVEQLRIIFAQHGIPETMVSDNGPQFASDEFSQFCRMNGIHHVRVAPYHPSSNGLTERAVQTVKHGLRKMKDGNLQTKLSRFLFSYRITPQSTTGRSPAELLMQRQLRSCLNLVQPCLSQKVAKKQEQQKKDHDKRAQSRFFQDGEEVFVKNYGCYGNSWLEGTIVALSGSVLAIIELSDGTRVKRHFEQIRKRYTVSAELRDTAVTAIPDVNSSTSQTEGLANEDNTSVEPDSDDHSLSDTRSPPEVPSSKRYPTRVRNPPDRYELEV